MHLYILMFYLWNYSNYEVFQCNGPNFAVHSGCYEIYVYPLSFVVRISDRKLLELKFYKEQLFQ
jgi:hypothetical protein